MFPQHARIPCRTTKKYLKLFRITGGEIVQCVVFKKDDGELATPPAQRLDRIVHFIVMQQLPSEWITGKPHTKPPSPLPTTLATSSSRRFSLSTSDVNFSEA